MLQTQPGVMGGSGPAALLLSWLVHTHGFFSHWDFLFPESVPLWGGQGFSRSV